MTLALLATAAWAGRCLDGTQVTFAPGVEGCVVNGAPGVQIRRNGPATVFELPPGAEVLHPVGLADLDGDPTLEWVLVQRCATDNEGCAGERTWIIDPDPGPTGPLTSWELEPGEVWVTRGMVFVARGGVATCTTLRQGGLWPCGTFRRVSP